MTKPLAPAPPRVTFDWIDGLRGIAILMVLANHWFSFFVRNFGERWHFRELWRLVMGGNMGVLLFFIVSAFTILHAYESRLPFTRHPYIRFFIRRAFRILPPWWIAITMIALVQGDKPWRHLCSYFFYFSFTGSSSHIHAGDWSLFVEETFYLLFIPLLPLVRSLGGSFGLLIGTILLRGAWIYIFPHIPFVQREMQAELFPLAHYYAFAIGIILYHGYRLGWAEQLRAIPHFPKFLSALTMLLLYRFLGLGDWTSADDISAIALTLLFVCAMIGAPGIRWFCELPLLRAFGKTCYSIYLFHLLLIYFLGINFGAHLQKWGIGAWSSDVVFFVSYPLFCFLCLLVGWIGYYAFERPFIRMGSRLIELLSHREKRLLRQAHS